VGCCIVMSLVGIVVVSSFASLVIVGFNVVINGIIASTLLLSIVNFGVVVVSKVCFTSGLEVVLLIVIAQQAGEFLPEEMIAV